MDESTLKIDEQVVESVKKLTEELFEQIGLKVGVKVSHDKESEALAVDLDSPDSVGLIIGRRGETISSIQHVLGLMVRQKLGGWVRVVVNVGDWREKQEKELNELALQTAQRARETEAPQSLYNLNPSQRRVIHMALSEEKDIETTSEGEGRDRRLIISLKKQLDKKAG